MAHVSSRPCLGVALALVTAWLTALVLAASAPVPPVESRRDALVQVDARAQHSDYGRPLPND